MDQYQKGRSSARLSLRGERAFLFLPFKHEGHKGLMAATGKRIFQPVPAEVGKVVLDAACAVHTDLGPGLLESVYQDATKHVIESNGALVEIKVKLPILFRRAKSKSGLRLDMLGEKCVKAELKSVEKMNPVYEAELLTYLRLSNVRLGFLIDFYMPHLKDGIKPMVV